MTSLKSALLFVFLMFSIPGFAFQDLMQIGAKVGANYHSVLSSSHYTDSTFQLGILGGIAVEMPISEAFLFEFDLMWIPRGSESQISFLNPPTLFVSTFNTLSIPALLLFRFPNSKKVFVPFFGFGVEPFYIISGTFKNSVTGAQIDATFVPWGFGGTVTTGFKYHWDTFSLGFDLRAVIAAADISNVSSLSMLTDVQSFIAFMTNIE